MIKLKTFLETAAAVNVTGAAVKMTNLPIKKVVKRKKKDKEK